MFINKQEVQDLLEYTGKPAISIYIPTARSGKEVNNKKNKIELKAQWDQIKRDDELNKFSDNQVDNFDSYINNLLEDQNFWHYQEEGLAVFLGDEFFKYFKVPILFEASYFILDSFYIIPFVPAFSPKHSFYLLTLTLKEVHLYQADQQGIKEVFIDNLIPSQLEERVGYDYKEKTLESKKMNNVQGAEQFHGYGGAKRDQKAEIKNYFSGIDKGLQSYLHNKSEPLVIMGQENFLPLYKEINSYGNLYDQTIAKNPSDMDKLTIHHEAIKAMSTYFKQTVNNKLKTYKDQKPELKSASLHDLIPASFEGRIDTIFIEKGKILWGDFDKQKMVVEVHDSKKENSIALLNFIVQNVLRHNGEAFLLKGAFMPDKTFKVNALLRY